MPLQHSDDLEGFEDVLGSGGVWLRRVSHAPGTAAHDEVEKLRRPEYKSACLVHVRGRVRAAGLSAPCFVDTLASGQPLRVVVGDTIVEPVPPGVMLALRFAGEGETVRVAMDNRYGYGDEGHAGLGVPPDADLEYEVTMLQAGEPHKEPPEMDVDELCAEVAMLKARGNEYFSWGKLDRALRCFKEAVRYGEAAVSGPAPEAEDGDAPAPEQARQDLVACLNNIALVLERQGKLKEAKEAAVQVILQDRDNVKALVRAARISLQVGDHEEAAVAVKAAMQVAPRNATVLEAAARLREAAEKAKRLEKERWGGFLQQKVKAGAASSGVGVVEAGVASAADAETTPQPDAAPVTTPQPRSRRGETAPSAPPSETASEEEDLTFREVAERAPLVVRLTLLLLPTFVAAMSWSVWTLYSAWARWKAAQSAGERD